MTHYGVFHDDMLLSLALWTGKSLWKYGPPMTKGHKITQNNNAYLLDVMYVRYNSNN